MNLALTNAPNLRNVYLIKMNVSHFRVLTGKGELYQIPAHSNTSLETKHAPALISTAIF